MDGRFNKMVFLMIIPTLIFIYAALGEPALEQVPEVANESVDVSFVCKAATASQMGKNINIMQSEKVGSKYHITYVRPDDGTVWGVYCWIENSRVLWQGDGLDYPSDKGKPGRVRNGEYDDVITYSMRGDTILLNTKRYDGSSTLEEFIMPQG